MSGRGSEVRHQPVLLPQLLDHPAERRRQFADLVATGRRERPRTSPSLTWRVAATSRCTGRVICRASRMEDAERQQEASGEGPSDGAAELPPARRARHPAIVESDKPADRHAVRGLEQAGHSLVGRARRHSAGNAPARVSPGAVSTRSFRTASRRPDAPPRSRRPASAPPRVSREKNRISEPVCRLSCAANALSIADRRDDHAVSARRRRGW